MMPSFAGTGRVQVKLFTKRGCHLCEDLRDGLLAMQPDLEFILVERDIERNPDELERYRELVPVLEVPGAGMFYPPHDIYALRQAISSAVDAHA